MNECLLNLVQRKGMVAVFAHPIDESSKTGRDEENLQFLGHYTAVGQTTGFTWSDSSIEKFAVNLPGKGEGTSARVKEALWLKADGNIRATFRFAGIDETNVHGNRNKQEPSDRGDNVDDKKPSSTDTCLDAESNAGNGGGSNDETTDSDSSGEDSVLEGDWRTGKLNLDGKIAQLNIGYTRKRIEENVDGGVMDSFGQLMQAADTSNMANDFISQGHIGLLFQDGDEEKKRKLGEKLKVSMKSMFSFLSRLSVGAAYRLIRRNIVKKTKKQVLEMAGYLMTEQDHNYADLGQVVQRSPTPFPIRTYDLNTQFQRECCASTEPSLFGYDEETGKYGMPMLSEVSDEVLKNVIITSLIVRTTGRVEHLREYLEYAITPNIGKEWKRMFKSSDCRFLPLFIAASSGMRDSTTAYLARSSMSAWICAQFTESLPGAVRESPKSYSSFLCLVEKELGELVRRVLNGELKNREAVVTNLCSIIRRAGIGVYEKYSNGMFMSHQIIADVEEVISGLGGVGNLLFEGDYLWAGYGGQQGFMALDHDEVFNCQCKGPGYKKWNKNHSPSLMKNACLILKRHVENNVDIRALSLLGLEKIVGGGGGGSEIDW
jgi:hypothetical protein